MAGGFVWFSLWLVALLLDGMPYYPMTTTNRSHHMFLQQVSGIKFDAVLHVSFRDFASKCKATLGSIESLNLVGITKVQAWSPIPYIYTGNNSASSLQTLYSSHLGRTPISSVFRSIPTGKQPSLIQQLYTPSFHSCAFIST